MTTLRFLGVGTRVTANITGDLDGATGCYGLDADTDDCQGDNCLAQIPYGEVLCGGCADTPHEFRHDGDPRFPNHCVCGRIRSIGGYSPVHTDESDDR